MPVPDTSPRTKGYQPIIWNFKLLPNDLLGGFAAWARACRCRSRRTGLAHESAPKNFTAVDVSDPRQPKVVCQTDLPHANMRSNSLETCGNMMAVAYQRPRRRICSRRASNCSTFPSRDRPNRFPSSTAPGRIRAACISSGSATANMSIARRDRAISFRPIRTGCLARGKATMSRRRRGIRSTRAFARTTPTSIRSDRCYLAYIDGGMFVLDISDKANKSRAGPIHRLIPASCTRWCRSSPFGQSAVPNRRLFYSIGSLTFVRNETGRCG